MGRRYTRRGLLAVGAASATGLLVGTAADRAKPPVDVRGAMYVPARAFNTYQMWHTYRPKVVERDLGNAARLNLNAVRTWLSYEAWEHDPDALARAIDHFLSTADDHGIRVLLGIFEGVGRAPTPRNLNNADPMTGTSVFSPSRPVMTDSTKWDRPRRFVRWFMDRYRDDERLLAVELMNEPGWVPWKRRFARGMFETLDEERGAVPLTVGATSLANAAEYYDWGIDVVQFHYNFPNSADIYRDVLRQAVDLAQRSGVPVWLTEWQRVANFGWGDANVSPYQRGPDYSSLAPVIRESGVGNFFWSLMLKPAYMLSQRKRGIINGVFHEDGAVWSAEDARTIKSMSGDDSFDGRERREWPEWASAVKRQV